MRSILVLPLLVMATIAAFAQETDYAPGPRPAGLTIFDEIDDPVERDAFRAAWTATDPHVKRGLADTFAQRYPRSILLREAYELSAHANAETGDHAAALERAQRALRLLPENPSLLVMTADLAAKQSAFDLADTSARDALRYLADADAPAPLTAATWPRVRDGLRSTAYFVLGRVAAMRGAYADARRSLLMSLSLNHGEMEALYTLGVVQVALGDEPGAAASFAHVMRNSRALARAARESLQSLHARQPAGSNSFDEFAASLTWTPPQPPARAASPPAGSYAGSESCRECHAPIYERWRETGMSKMFRSYRAADVVGDFSSGQTVGGRARPVLHDGRHFIEIRKGDSAEWIRYPVDYLIGSKWQQAYATRLPDARLLVFPIQYSRQRSTWLNYWGAVDGPGSTRADISRFHTIPEGAIYQTSCAPCHTSQLKAETGGNPSFFAEFARTGQKQGDPISFREGGINCEMCHGPSRDHIERIKSGGTTRATHDTPLSFRRLPATQYAAICAQCHAQSAVHTTDRDGHVNYSPEVPFYRTYPVHLPSNFSRKAFYRDGRYRATTFISESFARTKCFRAGDATCGSCHDPHPPDAASNPTSLKFRDDPDRMCVQCHTQLADRPERHTRHQAGTDAGRCVSCHMPRIMDALLFPARSHQIDDVPDAEMTARFGTEDSPNACLGCHADRDVEWLREETAKY